METAPLFESEEVQKEHTRIRQEIGRLFDEKKDINECLRVIIDRISKYKTLDIPEVDQVLKELENLKDSNLTKEEFVEVLSSLAKPIIRVRLERPQEIEEIDRQGFLEGGGDHEKFIPVNQLICYGTSGPVLHLHVQPNRRTPPAVQRRLMLNGLKEIAKILSSDPRIQKITARSWIVAEHPGIMERLGFHVELPKKPNDPSEMYEADAEMDRGEFLGKYLEN